MSEWISVEDRLPSKWVDITFVLRSYNDTPTSRKYRGKGVWDTRDTVLYWCYIPEFPYHTRMNVKAGSDGYQPLPEPPEATQDCYRKSDRGLHLGQLWTVLKATQVCHIDNFSPTFSPFNIHES